MDLGARLDATEYAVEADSFAGLMLWQEWAEEARRQWGKVREHFDRVEWLSIGDGYGPNIGDVAGRPVNVSVLWALIEGRLVLFYYGMSQLVDHQMIDAWLRERLPQLFQEGERVRTTDAMNFGNVVHAIRGAAAPLAGPVEVHAGEVRKRHTRSELLAMFGADYTSDYDVGRKAGCCAVCIGYRECVEAMQCRVNLSTLQRIAPDPAGIPGTDGGPSNV